MNATLIFMQGAVYNLQLPCQALVGKYMEKQGFYQFKFMKNYGNLSFWSVLEPKKDKQIYFVDVKETR